MREKLTNKNEMKIRAYLRIATGTRKGFKIEASSAPDMKPLSRGGQYGAVEFLPTVFFAVDFVVPDELFQQARLPIAEVNIAMKDAQIPASVLVPTVKNALVQLAKGQKS